MSNLYRPDYYGGLGYGDYNRYMRIDGMVCRDDRDCTWLDQNMGCDDRSLRSQPITVIISRNVIVSLVLKFVTSLLGALDVNAWTRFRRAGLSDQILSEGAPVEMDMYGSLEMILGMRFV